MFRPAPPPLAFLLVGVGGFARTGPPDTHQEETKEKHCPARAGRTYGSEGFRNEGENFKRRDSGDFGSRWRGF